MKNNLAYLSEFKGRTQGGLYVRQPSPLERPLLGEGLCVKWASNPDGSGSVLYDGWEDMYGSDELSMVRNGWIYHIHPDDRLGAIEDWAMGHAAGEPYQSTRLALMHGTYRPVTSLAFPIKDARGQIVRWEGYCQLVNEKAVNF